MKSRRITSFVIAAAMAMTYAMAIFPKTAVAETVNTVTAYSEDFEGFDVLNQQNTLQTLKNSGWYACDHTQLYTNVAAVAPYSTMNYKLANIETVDGSKVLRIVTAGEAASSEVTKYGYGRALPGVDEYGTATGVYNIQFDYKPILNKSAKTQFYFGLNTADGSAANDTDAQHNILSGYDQTFYLGYRNNMTLYNGKIAQGSLPAAKIGGTIWYTIKATVDCDNRYYSVEIYNRSTGKLIARRSPISFAGAETVGFLKFSALGISYAAAVYIDNISIEKTTTRNALIYEDNFDYSSVKLATEAMSVDGESEDVKGSSYFEGYTPWRGIGSIGNAYGLENDGVLGSRVVKLGDDPETADKTEKSGLVYAPVKDMLLKDAATQEERGKVKLSFKIKPVNIGSTAFQIYSMSDHTAANAAKVFEITNNGTAPAINGVDLDASKWYDADVVIDISNKSATGTLKDHSTQALITEFSHSSNKLTAVKGIMFNAVGGTTVYLDDVKLKYATTPPSVSINRISATDCFGQKIKGAANVPTSVKKIEIPMGCPVTAETANPSTILLTDSNVSAVNYTGTVSENSYIMELNSVLSLNEEYTLTIPETVANAYGDLLGEEVTFTFNTVNTPMDVSAVSVDGVPFGSLWDIAPGSTVGVTISYANNTAATLNSKVALAFYGYGNLTDIRSADFAVAANTQGVDGSSVEFTVPADIDMEIVDRMSIFVWGGLDNMNPLAQTVNVNRKTGKAVRYKDYVDFEVNVESGREPVILQITDTQIIDSNQIREGVTMNPYGIAFWKPNLMDQRLYSGLRQLITEVDPDLILMTGDLVYGGYDDAGTSFTRLADFMDGFDIPWAPVFGNHENESQMGVDWQCDYLEDCKNCLFKQRTLTGNGNYSIGIVQGGALKRVIFMLDSNGCAVMSDESFANGHSKKSAGFGDDQIEWYTDSATKINRDFENIKYTFAFHIQPAVFAEAFSETYGFVNGGEVNARKDLVNSINIDEREDKKATDFGYIGRSLKGAWDADKTVYNGMKALGADSILVGHEHCNSASVVYDGVRFQYGQKTGEYDRINFRMPEGSEETPIVGAVAYANLVPPGLGGTPILGGTVMKLSEETGEISDAYIHYYSR